MALRAYDELVQEAGLADSIPGVSLDSPMGKILAMLMSNVANKALQRILIFGVIGWTVFVLFIIFPSADGNFFIIFPLFCIGPIVISIIIVGGYGLLMNTLLGLPEAMMSSILLKRGDVLQVRYKQVIKRAVTLKAMSFTLVLQESATYDQGTSTVTETHDHVIDDITDFEFSVSPDMGIDRTLRFTIPDTAMHSFEAYRNKLDWYLRVKFDIPNFPDFHRNYKLRVLPEVNNES